MRLLTGDCNSAPTDCQYSLLNARPCSGHLGEGSIGRASESVWTASGSFEHVRPRNAAGLKLTLPTASHIIGTWSTPDMPPRCLWWSAWSDRWSWRARPKQLTKNLLVYLALFFTVNEAWYARDPSTLLPLLTQTTLAFAIFSVLSGAVYLINDIFDADSDRQHSTKRFRPIASGQLPTSDGLDCRDNHDRRRS